MNTKLKPVSYPELIIPHAHVLNGIVVGASNLFILIYILMGNCDNGTNKTDITGGTGSMSANMVIS